VAFDPRDFIRPSTISRTGPEGDYSTVISTRQWSLGPQSSGSFRAVTRVHCAIGFSLASSGHGNLGWPKYRCPTPHGSLMSPTRRHA